MNRLHRVYLFTMLGACGGLIAAVLHQWVILPLRVRAGEGPGRVAVDLLLGIFIGASIGFLPRFSEALGRHNTKGALRATLYATGLAALGGLLAVPLGERLHHLLQGGFLGRACSVGLLGLALGLAEAYAGGSRLWRGVAGGLAGGFLAGIVLEFLVRALDPSPDSAIIALVLLGLLISLSVALFVHVRSEAFLEGLYGSKVYGHVYHVTRFHEPEEAVIGSSGKVFLWLPDAEPSHASFTMTSRGGRLKNLVEGSMTLVNNHPVLEQYLKDGDVIQIGEARLRYRERSTDAVAHASRPDNRRVRFKSANAGMPNAGMQ